MRGKVDTDERTTEIDVSLIKGGSNGLLHRNKNETVKNFKVVNSLFHVQVKIKRSVGSVPNKHYVTVIKGTRGTIHIFTNFENVGTVVGVVGINEDVESDEDAENDGDDEHEKIRTS